MGMWMAPEEDRRPTGAEDCGWSGDFSPAMALSKNIYERIPLQRRDALTEGRDYYRGLIKGYEEGLNRAWDELIGLTTKGYSSREIQVMAKSKRQSIGQIVRERKIRVRNETGVDLFMQTSNAMTSEVLPGRAFLIESGMGNALKVFDELLASGYDGLIISRKYPGDIRSHISGDPQMMWLTRQERGMGVDYPCLSPSDQGVISSTVIRFMREGERRVVMFEGVDYMLLQGNDFQAVAKFLHGLIDHAISTRSILLIPINPVAFEEKDLRKLENIAYVLSS